MRYENETSEVITIKRGVRTGCILARCLFDIYTEYLIRKALEDGEGRNINGQNITNIRYVDDTILPLSRNTQSVIAHTNLGYKFGGPWTLAIVAGLDTLTFDLTQLIRLHIQGKI